MKSASEVRDSHIRVKLLKFHGQRWEYRIGNTVVFADNAFALSLRPSVQERLIVNDEVVQRGSSAIRQNFSEPWLTMAGDQELRVVMTSRFLGVHCAARLSGELIAPFAYWIAAWKGERDSWPSDDRWSPAGRQSWIVR